MGGMLTRMDDSIGSTLKQAELYAQSIVLERLHYFSQKRIRRECFVDPSALRLVLPAAVDAVLMTLTTFVWAERVQTQTYDVVMHYPATPWQMLRAQLRRWATGHAPWWFPRWLRWCLRDMEIVTRTVTRRVEFTHYLKFPEFMPAEAERVTSYAIGEPVPEVRVNGSWHDTVEGGKWWEDD